MINAIKRPYTVQELLTIIQATQAGRNLYEAAKKANGGSAPNIVLDSHLDAKVGLGGECYPETGKIGIATNFQSIAAAVDVLAFELANLSQKEKFASEASKEARPRGVYESH